MTGQQYEEIESLAAFMRMPLPTLVSLAYVVAGDSVFRSLEDLNYEGANDLIGLLRTYGNLERGLRERRNGLIAA